MLNENEKLLCFRENILLAIELTLIQATANICKDFFLCFILLNVYVSLKLLYSMVKAPVLNRV